jgi:hypothetical protein
MLITAYQYQLTRMACAFQLVRCVSRYGRLPKIFPILKSKSPFLADFTQDPPVAPVRCVNQPDDYLGSGSYNQKQSGII